MSSNALREKVRGLRAIPRPLRDCGANPTNEVYVPVLKKYETDRSCVFVIGWRKARESDLHNIWNAQKNIDNNRLWYPRSDPLPIAVKATPKYHR